MPLRCWTNIRPPAAEHLPHAPILYTQTPPVSWCTCRDPHSWGAAWAKKGIQSVSVSRISFFDSGFYLHFPTAVQFLRTDRRDSTLPEQNLTQTSIVPAPSVKGGVAPVVKLHEYHSVLESVDTTTKFWNTRL